MTDQTQTPLASPFESSLEASDITDFEQKVADQWFQDMMEQTGRTSLQCTTFMIRAAMCYTRIVHEFEKLVEADRLALVEKHPDLVGTIMDDVELSTSEDGDELSTPEEEDV